MNRICLNASTAKNGKNGPMFHYLLKILSSLITLKVIALANVKLEEALYDRQIEYFKILYQKYKNGFSLEVLP